MASVYLDRRDVALSLDGRRLCIREPDCKPRTLPLNLVDRLTVRGRASLDSAALGALAERGVPVVLLSGRRGDRVALVSGSGHGDARRRVAQYRLQDRADVRLDWSRRLVAAKLLAQRRMLMAAQQVRPDRRRVLLEGAARLDKALAALESPGPDSRDGVLGVEGAAAAAYFGALTALFPEGLDFTGRNRRPPRDPVNACLSLGYTLLQGDAVAACHAAGLDPMLGFFHDPAYGRASLACDLVEPLRPRVDAWVWGLFRDRRLRAEHFRRDGEACLLDKAGRGVFWPAWEQSAPPLRRWLRLRAWGVVRGLGGLAPDWESAP